eukprot:CAMPEP_0119552208 /NCGR_PEP_ID=MMETSP1352-20130426/5260_1 /TAXON_ID=265584 /ORGANISM="Stauroneis constricta, Strain CCMP1120" /LENGTH=412 /DNA_ID=CAMNT_0007598401 /DNA_START=375 /DNA_END=1613 /DNA_ORIENTATION=-
MTVIQRNGGSLPDEKVAGNNQTMQPSPPPPAAFLCRMTGLPMKEPMMSCYGVHYERRAILDWINSGKYYCPITRKPLRPSNLISDEEMATKIRCWADDSGYAWPNVVGSVHAKTTSTANDNDGQNSPSSMPTNNGSLEPPDKNPKHVIETPSPPSSWDDAEIQATGSNAASVYRVASEMVVSFHPDRYICPLTRSIMKDPVMSRTGVNYERQAILKHLEVTGYVCPVTNKALRPSGIVANCKLRHEISHWIFYTQRGKVPTSAASSDDGMDDDSVFAARCTTTMVVPDDTGAATSHGGEGPSMLTENNLELLRKVLNRATSAERRNSNFSHNKLSSFGDNEPMLAFPLHVPVRDFADADAGSKNGAFGTGGGGDSKCSSGPNHANNIISGWGGDPKKLAVVLDDVLSTVFSD